MTALKEAPIFTISETDMHRYGMLDTFEHYNMKVSASIPFFIVRTEPTFMNKIKLKMENFEIIEKPEEVGYTLSPIDGIYVVETLTSKKLEGNWLENHLKLMDLNPPENVTTSKAYVESFCSRTAFLKKCERQEFHINGSYMKKLYENTSRMPKDWNMNNLRNILQQNHQEEPISGITTPMLYASNANSGSRMHVEDFDFSSVSLLYPKSAPTIWRGFGVKEEAKFNNYLKEKLIQICSSPILHQNTCIDNEFFADIGINGYYAVQRPGDFIFTRGAHEITNTGYGLTETVRFMACGNLVETRRRFRCDCDYLLNHYQPECWNKCIDMVYGEESQIMSAIMGMPSNQEEFEVDDEESQEDNTDNEDVVENVNDNTDNINNRTFVETTRSTTPPVSTVPSRNPVAQPEIYEIVLRNPVKRSPQNSESASHEVASRDPVAPPANNGVSLRNRVARPTNHGVGSTNPATRPTSHKVSLKNRKKRSTPVVRARKRKGLSVGIEDNTNHNVPSTSSNLTVLRINASHKEARQKRITDLVKKSRYNEKYAALKKSYNAERRVFKVKPANVTDSILIHFRERLHDERAKMKYHERKLGTVDIDLMPDSYINSRFEEQRLAEGREIYKILRDMLHPSQHEFLRNRFINGYNEYTVIRDFVAQNSEDARKHFIAAVNHVTIPLQSKQKWISIIEDKEKWDNTFGVDRERRIPAEDYEFES